MSTLEFVKRKKLDGLVDAFQGVVEDLAREDPDGDLIGSIVIACVRPSDGAGDAYYARSFVCQDGFDPLSVFDELIACLQETRAEVARAYALRGAVQ